LYDKAQDEMKENYKSELEGNNLSYAEKLEEMMLNDESKKTKSLTDANGDPIEANAGTIL
jgi:hypothetical protein|tara:strand:- start:825 stop:1004 length:180 start_codon:yes stop_codon:yes gene_type:complete